MTKHAPPRRKMPSPWLIGSLVMLALAIAWRYLGAPAPQKPRQRPESRSISRGLAYAPATSQPQRLPQPLVVLDSAPPIEPVQEFEFEEQPLPVEPAPEETPRAMEEVPVAPQSDLPPCPEPLGQLYAAWSRHDWAAMHEILSVAATPQDCTLGEWHKLSWAYYEIEALIHQKKNYIRNPFQAIRSMHLAILEVLDHPESMVESTIEITGVSEGQVGGFQRVEGNDSITGNPVVVLTQQATGVGSELSFWAVAEPESPEPGLLRDMSVYAMLGDRTILDRVRNDEKYKPRLRSDIREAFDTQSSLDTMNLLKAGKEKRDSIRENSVAILAQLDARNKQSEESKIQQSIIEMATKETDLHKRLGETIKALQAPAQAPKPETKPLSDKAP